MYIVYSCILLYIFVHSWYTLVYSCVFLYILVYSCIFLYILVYSCIFLYIYPDGSKVCSTGKDNHIKLFNVKDNSLIITSKNPECYQYDYMYIHHDHILTHIIHSSCVKWFNNYLLCGGEKGTLYMLDSVTLITINQIKSHTGNYSNHHYTVHVVGWYTYMHMKVM